MDSVQKTNVLVVLATGKMGTGVTDAFLASGRHNVFGTSRDANSPSLIAKGVTPVVFEFGSKKSMVNAIKLSQAKVVFINTDFFNVAQSSSENEKLQGVAMIDACIERGVEHVIHCSVLQADTASLQEFTSKHHIEKHLAESGLSHTILRPAFFFSNFDDAANDNALVRGRLSYILEPNTKVAFVDTYDLGIAAVKASENSSQWAGKTLDCSSGNYTLEECTQALSTVSGVECSYSVEPSLEVQREAILDLYHLSVYCNEGNFLCNPEPFRRLIGEGVCGPHEYFTRLGKWANGDRYNDVPTTADN